MKCSICNGFISSDEITKTCDKCESVFHQDCWDENSGCATPGCMNLTKLVQEQSEVPWEDSYYGQSTKVCPACKEIIKVNELVCPFCNERFNNIRPVTSDELKSNLTKLPQLTNEKKVAMAIFICGLLGFPAPLNLIIGGAWYSKNREKLRKGSPLHNFFVILGLSFSVFYSIFIAISLFSR